MFDTVQIGKRIAGFRKQKNLTQFELADAMGVSFQAVSNWERGNSMPDISKLTELSDILGTTVDGLLGKTNPVVEKMVREQPLDAGEIDREDLIEAAEISKPRQVEEMIESGQIADIAPLLPFLSDDYIAGLADKYYEEKKSLVFLLPFLSEEKVDELMKRAEAEGREVSGLFPFASERQIPEGARRRWRLMFPSMDEDDIRKFAEKIIDRK